MTNYAPDTLEPADTWRQKAACLDVPDADVMFPDPTDKPGTKHAKTFCARCPVVTECLREAMADEGSRRPASRFGVRGTYTPEERYQVYQRYIRRAAKSKAVA